MKVRQILESLKKIGRKAGFRKFVIILGGVVLVLAIFFSVLNLIYLNKILPQTYVGGVNVGGKTKAQAEKILADKITTSIKSDVKLKSSEPLDKSWTINSNDINLAYSASDSAIAAYSIGREGGLGKIAWEEIRAIFSKNKIPLVFSYNNSSLTEKILGISDEIDVSEKDALIIINDDLSLKVEPEKTGRMLSYEEAKEDILSAFGAFGSSPDIKLQVQEIQPKVTAADTTEAMTEATKILQNKLELKSPKKSYVLSSSDLAKFLQFFGAPDDLASTGKVDLKKVGGRKDDPWKLKVGINLYEIQKYVNEIATETNQEPKDAQFQVADGKVTAFQNSQTGYSLNQEKTLPIISKAILDGSPNAELAVTVIQPEIASDSAASMGLVELIGEGKSSWRGSPKNRIANLTLGAKKISGTIVKPGEEFSTVKSIGAIDAASGFLPELVIKNGTEVVPDIGGGLCQVSTTLFRAALYSGLEITAREPHSFRVSYYEPPVGMDATIFDPQPDFKFINNYSKPILLWAVAGSNSLTFQVYGTKDGRQIEVSDPVLGDYISPGPDVYTESATMEPGSIRQVEKALAGVTASFNYKVTSADGKVLQKETFISKYIALSNSYLVGPGYQAPPPAE